MHLRALIFGILITMLAGVVGAQSGEIFDPAAGPSVPRVVYVGAVAPDTLCIEVHARDIVYGRLQPYALQQGDRMQEDAAHHQAWILRDGKIVGATSGPGRKLWWNLDQVIGDDLDIKVAMLAASYRISSSDDVVYAAPVAPKAVHRKSKPRGMARTGPWNWGHSLDHKLYLVMPSSLSAGRTYRIDLAALGLPTQSLRFEPASVRSEAVHVNHVGFRPDDPAKRAYLSLWMGDGGAVDYSPGREFKVVDVLSQKVAYTGKALMGVAKTAQEDAYKRNHNRTDVWWMDFADMKQPGEYRIVVDGIGCSYPFVIRPDVYDAVFYTSARGLYHQRSGIELRPPYTAFSRPRCFHPDDGVVVFQSTCSLMDSGNGLNARGTDTGNFGNLVNGATKEVVPGVWGGYFDAGDWDRRIQHLMSSRYLLELMEMFPGRFEKVTLNIPETGNGLPDLVNEAIWGLEVYRRLQLPDGGIRGGIEQSEHPWAGETSWLESKPRYAYAPDEWCSYLYAGDAARASLVLRKYNKALADQWQESAVRAFVYGEKRTDAGQNYAHFQVRDRRCNAAVELWRLTGEPRYHDIFLATTLMTKPGVEPWVWQKQDQLDATFLYARIDLPGQDQAVRSNCRSSFLRYCKGQPVDKQGFNWTKLNPWAPVTWGPMSTPRAELVRAHWLSGDDWYLRSAVLNCQSPLGGNPVNMAYTVGVGHDWPRNPLICDMRIGSLPPFPGITIGGPADPVAMKEAFGQKLCAPAVYPEVTTWPTADAYFDVWMYPPECEYTIDANIAPHAYVMGYLAARPED